MSKSVNSNVSIAVIDYGSSNLGSVMRTFQHLDLSPQIVVDPEQLGAFDAIILPGVGSASFVLPHLRSSGMFDAIKHEATKGKGVFGICLGYQLLFKHQAEAKNELGFSFLHGDVEHLRSAAHGCKKIPNINWSSVYFNSNPSLKIDFQNAFFYFSHSYFVNTVDPYKVLAKSLIDGAFEMVCVAGDENIIGCQFHPEKSGPHGLEFLRWALCKILQ